MTKKTNSPSSAQPAGDDWTAGLSNPARRALAAAGITRLEQLARFSEAELLALHGFGPKSIRILTPVLAARGLTFAAASTSRRVSEAANRTIVRRAPRRGR